MCKYIRQDTLFIGRGAFDGDQVEEDFTNGGRGHPPKHLKFFLLVFSKIKEELNKERTKPRANKKTTSIQEWAPINISL